MGLSAVQVLCMIFIVHTIAGDQPLLKLCWLDAYAGVAFVHAHEVPRTKARVFEPPAKPICSSASRALSIVGWASVLVEDQAMGDDIHGPWSKLTKSIGI